MEMGCRAVRKLTGTIAVLSGLLMVPAAQAATPDALSRAADFVLETSREAVAVINTDANGRAKLKSLFMARFDHELMGRYAMGAYWPKASDAQQREFRLLFAEYVPAGYADQLAAYHKAEIAVIRSETVKDGDAMISTRVMTPSGEESVLHWRVRSKVAQHKVIDIVAGGVSYLSMLRTEFTAYTAKNGIDGMLDMLRTRTAAKASSDIDGIAAKMRATGAIGMSSKLAIKRKIDTLVDDLGRYHGGEAQLQITSLKTRFDSLIQSVVSLLQSGDPSLAAEIELLHTPLWGKLSDPRQFAVVAMC